MIKPVIAYPGSKLRFYPYMVDYFPLDMKTLIEPFFGGGSVSLSVADDPRFSKLERIVAGDLYTEIWVLWRAVKEQPDSLIAKINELITSWCPHQKELHALRFYGPRVRQYKAGEIEAWDSIKSMNEQMELYNLACEEGKNFWKWSQEVNVEQLDFITRAARMYIVSKISFSGMGDAASMSEDKFCGFNISLTDSIPEASKLFQKIEIKNVSFEETMKAAYDDPKNSFIFLDPPYANQESSGLYGKDGTTHKGFPHQHFADFTMQMPCKWFVTYDDSVIVRRLFKGKTAYSGKRAKIIPFKIPGGYLMASKTSEDALAGEELFILNYDAECLKPAELV